jgi:hypothetical protein
MKFFIVTIFLCATLFCNAQNAYQYKFAASDTKISIPANTIQNVLNVLQKRLESNRYGDATCTYDSVTKLFVIQSISKIDIEFVKNILLQNAKSGLFLYELYKPAEILNALATSDDKKTYLKKMPLFVTSQNDIIAANNTGYINIVTISDTAKLSKDVIKYTKMLPADALICTGKSTGGDLKYAEVFALKNNDNKINTEGLIKSASTSVDDMGYINISIKFNEVGKAKFANITKQNINNCIAFVLNNNVYSAPKVMGEIGGGDVQISGRFTMLEASEFVTILAGERLPIKLKFVKSEIVKI